MQFISYSIYQTDKATKTVNDIQVGWDNMHKSSKRILQIEKYVQCLTKTWLETDKKRHLVIACVLGAWHVFETD